MYEILLQVPGMVLPLPLSRIILQDQPYSLSMALDVGEFKISSQQGADEYLVGTDVIIVVVRALLEDGKTPIDGVR